MAKDTPERFARLVLAKLADIHALVMGIHDYIMLDLAHTAHIPFAEAKKAMHKKRKERAKRLFLGLLKRVDLPKREGH
jgi:hypothetical protein